MLSAVRQAIRSVPKLRRAYSSGAHSVTEHLEAERKAISSSIGVWNMVALVSTPIILYICVRAMLFRQQELDHIAHEGPHKKYYDYLMIRTKPFPWGNGKDSVFHNSSCLTEEDKN